nr:valine--tRNA ligase, mitochondrial 1-like [Quercus suber]
MAVSETNPEIIKEKDLERKKKKADKAREKELKRQKALEKAAKLQAQQASNNQKKSEKKMVGGKEENPEEFLDPPTPFGEKKRISSQMAKQYSPTAVEKSWYAWWEKSGFFVADAKSSKPPFVIVSFFLDFLSTFFLC